MSVLNAVAQQYAGPSGTLDLFRERWSMILQGHNLVVAYSSNTRLYSLSFWYRGRPALLLSAASPQELAAKVDGFLCRQSAVRQKIFTTLLSHNLLILSVSRKERAVRALMAISEQLNRRRDSAAHGLELVVGELSPADISLRFGSFVYGAASKNPKHLRDIVLTPTWVMSSGQMRRYLAMMMHEIERINLAGVNPKLCESLEAVAEELAILTLESAEAMQCVWVEIEGDGIAVRWDLSTDEGETYFEGDDAHIRAYHMARRKLHEGRKAGYTKLADLSESVANALLLAHHESYLIYMG